MIYDIMIQYLQLCYPFVIYEEVTPVERYNITHRVPLNINDTMSPMAASVIVPLLAVESMNEPVTFIEPDAPD